MPEISFKKKTPKRWKGTIQAPNKANVQAPEIAFKIMMPNYQFRDESNLLTRTIPKV